ncbi:hypothetical protein [Comamonas thiooxydans]
MDGKSSPRGWLLLAAAGCRWLPLAAAGCRWLPLAAAGPQRLRCF